MSTTTSTRDASTATEYENYWYTSSRWVRSSVRDRSVHAAQLLSPTYTFALDEGWRPPPSRHGSSTAM